MLDPSKTTIVLGAAGCGKTTRLLGYVEESLVSGAKPWEVGFVSFTTKAAREGKERAVSKFGLRPDDFRHFRTLHSWAFSHLQMRRESVMGKQHLQELGELLGVEFAGHGSVDDDVTGMGTGDRMLFLEGYARNTKRTLRSVWEDAFEDSVDWYELERLQRGLRQFKESRGLSDFNDMMEQFTLCDPSTLPKLKLLVIDEVQDTSSLQWDAVRLLAENSDKVVVGGDDWQAIYGWSGANVGAFIDLRGTVVNLEQSYRIPKTVHDLSETIGSRIVRKRPRTFRPRPEAGAVNWLNSVEDSDLSKGTWLLLARNGYMLRELEDWCRVQGFAYGSVGHDPLKSPALSAIKTWEALRRGAEVSTSDVAKLSRYVPAHQLPTDFSAKVKLLGQTATMADLKELGLRTDAIWHQALSKISPGERDYFIAVRRRGEPLLKEPRIKVSTIHSVKGGEADHVLLMTDMSYRCYQNMEKDPDSEHRVYYVGATRCRETLNLVLPQTNLAYEV